MNNTEISIFETFNTEPVTTSLNRWIAACMNGNNKFAKQVKEYRQTGEDHLKKGLPLATVGAICEGGRKMEDVTHRTGWIALDIDAKDNPHLEDAEAVRDAISNIFYVAFAGLSVSGNGVWGLVKVEDPERQAQYFEQLQKDFLNRGIVLDSTKGKNPNDARFYSFDPEAYITDDFKIYDRLPKKPQSKPRAPSHSFDNNYSFDDTRSKVERLISKIQQQRVDITGDYHTWWDLAFALESEFGESGRDYFHAISEFYPGYSRRETDRQYTQCLKHRGSGISIGTFFYECRKHSITLSNDLNGSQSKYESQKNEDPAPHGMNPWTGEIFYKRGYPKSWDDIQLDEDSPEHKEAIKQAINDAAPDELKELCKRDPTVKKMIELFDTEPITEIQLGNKINRN